MKTKNEILDQIYMTAEDLTLLIPGLKLYKARNIISEIIKEMEELKMFIPNTKKKLASTKLIKKKLGI